MADSQKPPEVPKSLEEAFQLFRVLAEQCRLLNTYLRSPTQGYLGNGLICKLDGSAESIQTEHANGFNRLANELFLTFWLVSCALKSDNLQWQLSRRYSAPVRFSKVSSTCYASLAKDVALPCVSLLQDCWVKASGKLPIASHPSFSFTAEQLVDVVHAFDAVKVIVFSNPTEQLDSAKVEFGDLLIALRQEESWATETAVITPKINPPKPHETGDKQEETPPLNDANADNLGVTLADVASFFEPSDDGARKNLIRQWINGKKIAATAIGKCPNDARAQLYRLAEILSDIEKINGFMSGEKVRLRNHLVSRQRPPKARITGRKVV